MVLEFQKPKQSNRKKVRLPRVCRGRKRAWHVWRETPENLGDPVGSPRGRGRRRRPKEAEPKTSWESDQRIVLRERESRLQGEGAGVDTKPTKETLTGHEGTGSSANLPVGDSTVGPERNGIARRTWSACGGEYSRRARCGKTARRDLCGGCRVTGSPTAIQMFSQEKIRN
jgi:hypothetical protein